MTDTGDEAEVGLKKAAHKLTREKEVAELHALLQTYGGRAFLWRLLAECKIFDFGYCGENNWLNHIEGRRALGGWLMKEIDEADPKAYALMRDEMVSRDTISKK